MLTSSSEKCIIKCSLLNFLFTLVYTIDSGLLVFWPKCLYPSFLQVKPRFSSGSSLGSVSAKGQELDCVPEVLQHRAWLRWHRLGKCSKWVLLIYPNQAYGKIFKMLLWNVCGAKWLPCEPVSMDEPQTVPQVTEQITTVSSYLTKINRILKSSLEWVMIFLKNGYDKICY